MANKKSSKKKVQTKTQSQAALAPSAKAAPKKSAASAKKNAAPAKKATKAKKGEKPGVFTRMKNYVASVKSEMKRVVWPTKKELVNYSVAVCVSLLVVGVFIALLDVIIGEGLVLFASLRG